MLTNAEIKFIKSLQRKKERNESGLFVCEGEKPVSELLRSDWKVKEVFALSSWLDQYAEDLNVPFREIKESELERISGLTTPNKVLAVAVQKQQQFDLAVSHSGMSLFLDDIRDPGNLGTIIRIADWFGIKQVCCSENCVELYNPKTIQAAMGSLFHLPVCYVDPQETLMQFQSAGIQIIGAEMEGQSIFGFQIPETVVLVLGSESHGISNEIQRFLNEKINIPGFGKAESLNVAVACGILCAQYRNR